MSYSVRAQHLLFIILHSLLKQAWHHILSLISAENSYFWKYSKSTCIFWSNKCIFASKMKTFKYFKVNVSPVSIIFGGSLIFLSSAWHLHLRRNLSVTLLMKSRSSDGPASADRRPLRVQETSLREGRGYGLVSASSPLTSALSQTSCKAQMNPNTLSLIPQP